jgi:anti-anti-sigma factor
VRLARGYSLPIVGIERLSVDLERRGRIVRLRMAGRLDAATAPLVSGTLDALRREAASIVLDLEAVHFIDATGIELLLGAEADARLDARSIEIVGVPQSLRRRKRREASADPAGEAAGDDRDRPTGGGRAAEDERDDVGEAPRDAQ